MRAAVLVAILLTASPAFAQSAQNGSDASAEASEAAAALAEFGVKTTIGVVSVPLAIGGAVAEGAGGALGAAGSAATGSAGASAAFANEPLTVSEEVILAPAPQAAPDVPFQAQAPKPQP